MNTEKTCTLSIDHAIRIAKIIATAPVERLPMITQLFHQASVDLEGLEELIENTAISSQGHLIDTGEFLAELTAGRELTEKGYLIPPEEFNQFCLARSLQPRLVKRHLYAAGRIEGSKEEGGKIAYSITAWADGKNQRWVAVKATQRNDRPEG